MIIGADALAHRFMDFFNSSKYILFSGNINDSSIADENLFDIEKELIERLILEHPKKIIIFISTSSSGNSPYVLHKRAMEEIIEKNCKNFFIFRVPIFIGIQGSESNLINFYTKKQKIKSESDQIFSISYSIWITSIMVSFFMYLKVALDLIENSIRYTKEGKIITKENLSGMEIALSKNIRGRILAADLKDKDGKVLDNWEMK